MLTSLFLTRRAVTLKSKSFHENRKTRISCLIIVALKFLISELDETHSLLLLVYTWSFFIMSSWSVYIWLAYITARGHFRKKHWYIFDGSRPTGNFPAQPSSSPGPARACFVLYSYGYKNSVDDVSIGFYAGG